MITFQSTEDLAKSPENHPAHNTVKELVDRLITEYTPPGQPYNAEDYRLVALITSSLLNNSERFAVIHLGTLEMSHTLCNLLRRVTTNDFSAGFVLYPKCLSRSIRATTYLITMPGFGMKTNGTRDRKHPCCQRVKSSKTDCGN